MRIFSFMSLVLLAACTGGDCDQTECADGSNANGCTNCDDTGTNPFAEFATIKVTKASFLGTPDDCDVIVDEAKAGEVGDDITVEADSTHSVGVGAIGTDGFITHTLTDAWTGDSTWAGATVIVPEWDVKLDPEATDEREVEFNLYPFHANDWWSCTNDRNDSVDKAIAETDGATFYTPKGEMTLTGITLTKEGFVDARFTSISELSFVLDGESDINYTCYASDADGNVANPLEE